MEIYHLDSENTARKPITQDTIAAVKDDIREAAQHIRKNELYKKCSKENGSKCHLSHLCLSKTEQNTYTGG